MKAAILRFSHRVPGTTQYFSVARCACGTTFTARTDAIRAGASCGCSLRARQNHLIHGHASAAGETPTYATWSAMRRRCYDPRNVGYSLYGGRGIIVVDRWRDSFVNFLADMGPRPSRRHSIDRIDPNGNYEPGNCRWATAKEQVANRRAITHCKRGHEFTPANTRVSKGLRHCRKCDRLRRK